MRQAIILDNYYEKTHQNIVAYKKQIHNKQMNYAPSADVFAALGKGSFVQIDQFPSVRLDLHNVGQQFKECGDRQSGHEQRGVPDTQ